MALTDILGITIAFITLILLISIFVTALVQTAQGLLRLRARNLLKGLAALLVNIRYPDNDMRTHPDEVKQAKRDAMKLLNTPILAGSARVVPSTRGKNSVATPYSDLRYYLIGPRVSWIRKEDLPNALEQAKISLEEDGVPKPVVDQAKLQEFVESFERLDPQLDKRFLMMARGWSFALALVIAFLLQVSTPDLLRRLASDLEYRERILANVDKEADYAKGAIDRVDYERAAASALEQLAREFPDSRARIEQASGIGPNKALIMDELEIALQGDSKAPDILKRYSQLLNSAAAQAATDAQETLGRLNSYDIGIWRDPSFYYGPDIVPNQADPDTQEAPAAEPDTVRAVLVEQVKWKNIFGVLMTAILLSLGAPFWYKSLRDVIGFRDALAGKKADAPVEDPKKTDDTKKSKE